MPCRTRMLLWGEYGMSQDEQATGDVPVESPVENSGWHAAMLRLLGSTRLVVLFAVLGLFLTAATLLIYGSLLAIKTIWDTVTGQTLDLAGLEHLTVLFIRLTDAFLLGCVLIIVALGLYQLYIHEKVPLPAWLRVTTLDELEAKLLGIVVVLLGVSFVGVVTEWKGDSLLELGASIGAVIVAIAIYLAIAHTDEPDEHKKQR